MESFSPDLFVLCAEQALKVLSPGVLGRSLGAGGGAGEGSSTGGGGWAREKLLDLLSSSSGLLLEPLPGAPSAGVLLGPLMRRRWCLADGAPRDERRLHPDVLQGEGASHPVPGPSAPMQGPALCPQVRRKPGEGEGLAGTTPVFRWDTRPVLVRHS